MSSHETSYAQAVRDGALAFFGDRYGDVVRVVSMADPGAEPRPFSMEVCGGTHVAATGQLGTLCVLGESSIGGGMRRIEAISGRAAEQLFLEQSDRLATLSNKLQTPVADLESRLDSYIQDNEMLRPAWKSWNALPCVPKPSSCCSRWLKLTASSWWRPKPQPRAPTPCAKWETFSKPGCLQ